METNDDNKAAPSVDVPRLVRLWEIDDADLTDEQLETIINERYAPSVIPKCRICGGDMTIGASGGGQPTRWYCSVAQDSKPMDWKHFGDSLWEDRRQGGDSRVMELLRRFKANGAKGGRPRKTPKAEPPSEPANETSSATGGVNPSKT